MENVTLLIDPQRDALFDAIRALAARAAPEAMLFFYYVGHGEAVADEHYLLPIDASLDDLSGTSISAAAIASILLTVPAFGVLAMLDCCHGAAFVRSAGIHLTQSPDVAFRRVLCAASTSQQAWEFPDAGTLLSRNVAKVLRGELVVSENRGQIYHDDLKRELNRAIAQDLERLKQDALLQQLVEASFGLADPLVFVHRGLSADGVAVRTLRYDRRYVRNRIFIVLRWVASLLALALGMFYIFADNSQIATFENGRIVIDRGFMSLNPPGYPVLQFTTDVLANGTNGDDDFKQSGRGRLPGPLLGSVGPELEKHLSPEWQAVLFALDGRTKGAQRLTSELAARLAAPGVPDWPSAAAIADLGMISAADHELLLTTIAEVGGTAPSDVSRAAFNALTRHAPELAIEDSLNDDLSRDGPDWMILEALDAPCTASIKNYLDKVVQKSPSDFASGPELEPWKGAVIRTQCRLNDQSLSLMTSLGWKDWVKLVDTLTQDPARVAWLAGKVNDELAPILAGNRDFAAIGSLEEDIDHLAMVDPRRLPDALKQLLGATDERLRRSAEAALRLRPGQFDSSMPAAAQHFPAPNEAALLHGFSKMTNQDIAAAVVHSTVSTTLLDEMRKRLGRDVERHRAAIVLSMMGSPKDLEELLNSPYSTVRDMAATYGAFNVDAARAAIRSIPAKARAVAPFQLTEQLRKLDVLQPLLSRVPARAVKLLASELLRDTAYGLGEGARLRIAEVMEMGSAR